MSDPTSSGWEPEGLGTNWQSMFETQRTVRVEGQSLPLPSENDDFGEDKDIIESVHYRPWTLQRSHTQPALMLEMKRFESRSGLWNSWVLSYPSLYAIDMTGGKLLSLDFGTRQYVLEGFGLDKLCQQIQLGKVLKIIEYSSNFWKDQHLPEIVSKIIQYSHK